MTLKKFTFSLFVFANVSIFAQNTLNSGLLPKIVLSKEISDKTKSINTIESRFIVDEDDKNISFSLVDMSTILSFKTGLNKSFNFGYLLRLKNEETIHRTFQHFNIIQQQLTYKLAHRFAFEQFYQDGFSPTFRTRYRIGFQKALNGEQLDLKEFYIKIANEYLYNFNDLQIRLTPYLGYQMTKKNRIELGLDYRLSQFINKSTKNDIWFRATWYISLN